MTDEQTLANVKPAPDWKGFTEAVMEEWQAHCDLDAADKFELALKYNIIIPIPGGFDPEEHTDTYCFAEPGDDWYEWNDAPTDDNDATIARLTEQVNTLTTEKHADAEAIGALEAKLAEVTAAGTYAQGIEAAAQTVESLWAYRTCREVADAIRALYPTPQADYILDDSSLRAKVGELGNQIHTLGCEYQGDERLAERLGELRRIAWGLAHVASVAPQSNAVSGLTAHEQKSQAARCPCKGSDDWCPCQNAADRATRDARASTPKADPVREAANLRARAQRYAELLREAEIELEVIYPGSGFAASIRHALAQKEPTND